MMECDQLKLPFGQAEFFVKLSAAALTRFLMCFSVSHCNECLTHTRGYACCSYQQTEGCDHATHVSNSFTMNTLEFIMKQVMKCPLLHIILDKWFDYHHNNSFYGYQRPQQCIDQFLSRNRTVLVTETLSLFLIASEGNEPYVSPTNDYELFINHLVRLSLNIDCVCDAYNVGLRTGLKRKNSEEDIVSKKR